MHAFLLHGLGADSRAFQRFVRLLPGTWQPTPLDLLGHGTAPKPARGYSLDDHAAYIADQLRDRCDEPAAVIGHSYGAAVGTALAATAPELVSDLVLLDPIVDPRARTERAARADDDTTGTQMMMQARRDGTLDVVVRRLFAGESDALQRWVIETWKTMAVGVIDELDPDWMRFAPRVSCPVTVIHGEAARGGGGSEPAAYFVHPAVVEITGAGHYLHATHARETAREVITALSHGVEV